MLTLILGSIFLVLQGIEWVQLIAHGLTLTVDPYGSYFYLIVGAHALHVLAAVLWYLFALTSQQYQGNWTTALEAANVFWFFVVAVWPAVFIFVYI